MQFPLSIELQPAHASLWMRIQTVIKSQRLAHAFLWVGPRHAKVNAFVHRVMAALLCQSTNKPCGDCQPCRMLIQGGYPDIHYIQPETDKGSIKIDQIRELQQSIYQTPQRGKYQFILIEPADKLNRAAVNALLKILEEPPAHAVFMLVAEQLSSLPATIMSRCQQYIVPAPQHAANYLSIAAHYDESSDRAALFKQRLAIMDLLCDLIENKVTVCSIASQWSGYALEDIVWFLYLLISQAIQYRLLGGSIEKSEYTRFMHVSQRLEPDVLFNQLQQMNFLLKKVRQNIALNQTLALENLLLGMCAK